MKGVMMTETASPERKARPIRWVNTPRGTVDSER